MILTPKPRVDGTPRSKSNPKPLSHCCTSSGKKEPQMIITLLYIWHTKLQMMYTLDPQVVRQWAACNTLPQALWHDLVMTALLKQMRIHRLTKRKIQKLIKTCYARFRLWAQTNLTPVILTHFLILSCKCSSTHLQVILPWGE